MTKEEFENLKTGDVIRLRNQTGMAWGYDWEVVRKTRYGFQIREVGGKKKGKATNAFFWEFVSKKSTAKND